MNVIDHAILISASPEFIWRFLGDISQNPKWQEDCTNLSFLTTQHEGRGTRWRYETPKGKSIIVEISAWYDTLGYEYKIVEGSSVSENQGRIRLQEIAEGTLVQWTFNYELDGMLSGLRNAIGLKRTLTNNIQDSLRNLYKLVQQETGGISTHEARASLKEAPDVEERVSYQPRHPSNFKEDTDDDLFKDSDYPSESSIAYEFEREGIIEPPVDDGDTKPNPVIQGTDEIPPVDMSDVSLVNQIQEPPVADDDTKPNAPIETMEQVEPDLPLDPEVEPVVEMEDDEVESAQEQIEETPPVTDSPASREADIRDTSRISVFEVFGLQKPSETQEMSVITDEDLTEMSETEDNKRETLESEALHVDEPFDITEEEAEPTVEEAKLPEESQIADIPETVAPEVLEDKDTVTIPATQPSHSINGLRLEQRREIINLRSRR